MTTRDDLFALIGEDIDFIGDIVRADVPVLTYRWSNGEAVSNIAPTKLIEWGREAMEAMGMTNIRWQGLHLRSDSSTGQRIKMTVLSSRGRSTYLLMTAGMPGTRKEAKEINRQISERLESRALRSPKSPISERHVSSAAGKAGVRSLTATSVR